MKKSRIEAFSDGVVAIIITIMVLEMKVPHDEKLTALVPMIPVFLSYVLSFLYIGVYWMNHHHLFQAVERISGGVLWSNLRLLFWLSLIPFVTAWMGETYLATIPVAAYGMVLFMTGVAYYIMTVVLLKKHHQESVLATAIGKNRKGKISIGIYLVAIPISFVNVWIAFGLYSLTVIMWIIPDRRIEKALGE